MHVASFGRFMLEILRFGGKKPFAFRNVELVEVYLGDVRYTEASTE
jgi:hypothetical protein